MLLRYNSQSIIPYIKNQNVLLYKSLLYTFTNNTPKKKNKEKDKAVRPPRGTIGAVYSASDYKRKKNKHTAPSMGYDSLDN